MSVLRSVMDWLRSQSDLSQTLMVSGVTGAAASIVHASCAPAAANMLTLSSTAVMLGSQTWVASVAGPTMFVNMERSAFGNIQARLFPKLGMVGLSMSGLAMAGYIAHHSPDQAFLLLSASLLSNVLNSFLIFPTCTHYMYEKRKYEEGSEEFKKNAKMFGITHGVSVLMNLGSMAANFAFLYIVASRTARVL